MIKIGNALRSEIEKAAAEASELTPTILGGASVVRSPIGALASIVGSGVAGGLGYMAGPKTVEEMIRQNKRGVSNIFIPFVGAYRFGRRKATSQSVLDKAKGFKNG
jgi:hypothetical protein